jgi:hypothetical protein
MFGIMVPRGTGSRGEAIEKLEVVAEVGSDWLSLDSWVAEDSTGLEKSPIGS